MNWIQAIFKTDAYQKYMEVSIEKFCEFYKEKYNVNLFDKGNDMLFMEKYEQMKHSKEFFGWLKKRGDKK